MSDLGLYDKTCFEYICDVMKECTPSLWWQCKCRSGKCITVTLVLPGEVRHDPSFCRLLHIKDVFEELGHQYVIYTICSSHVSRLSFMLVFSIIVFWTSQNVDSIMWSPVWHGLQNHISHRYSYFYPHVIQLFIWGYCSNTGSKCEQIFTNSTQNLLKLQYSSLNVPW